ncbi:MAG: hypothetical protein M1826_004750 [Phylliscum demangeonii]|nr:MAG: hypothetical protein M1826_004750 [Phylliscum demangeonii]
MASRHCLHREVIIIATSRGGPCVLGRHYTLVAPLVFFIAPNDPRFLSTLDQTLKPPEKGGHTSTGLVYRYNHLKAEDGVGGH